MCRSCFKGLVAGRLLSLLSWDLQKHRSIVILFVYRSSDQRTQSPDKVHTRHLVFSRGIWGLHILRNETTDHARRGRFVFSLKRVLVFNVNGGSLLKERLY